MRRFHRLAAALAISCAAAPLASCAGLAGLAGAPPTAAALNRTSIDEAGIDLIRDLFDVALFGVDALADFGRIKPGTPEARNIARLIRQIAGFLGAADSAQKAGQAGSYDEALKNARSALRQFQQAIGMPAATPSAALVPLGERGADVATFLRAGRNLTDQDRLALASRLEGGGASGN